MGITLRHFDDAEFSSEFLAQIPAFESELVSHDFDPSDFVIEKFIASTRPLPMLFAQEPLPVVSYDYVVTVKSNSFTVTFSNDANFLQYFGSLCFSPDKELKATKENKLEVLFEKAKKWLQEDPMKKGVD